MWSLGLLSLFLLVPFGVCQQDIYVRCGVTLNCLGVGQNPAHSRTCIEDTDCHYVVGVHFDAVKDHLQTAFFSVANNIGNKNKKYIAIGISDDQIMGNDDVIAFIGVNATNQPIFVSARNVGKSVRGEVTLPPSEPPTFTLIDGSIIVEANFSRLSLPRDFKFTDFHKNTTYYLFIAVGECCGNTNSQYDLGGHGSDMTVSTYRVNFAHVRNLKGKGAEYWEVKVHGVCMIWSWTFLMPVAILVARYYKETWAHVRFFKRRMWFTVHVALMLLSLTLTLGGYAAIIIKNKGIFRNGLKHPTLPIHQAIGFVAIILMILQSVANWKRFSDPLFKTLLAGAHTFFGVVAYISGIYNVMMVEVLIGELLGLSFTLQYFPLVSFILLLVFFFFLSSFYSWTDSHLSVKISRAFCSYPLRVSSDEEAPRPTFRKRILYTFVFVSCIVTLIYTILFLVMYQ